MGNQKYITIYTLGIGILAGVIHGFKTTQGFLSGNTESLFFYLGGIIGSLAVPLGIALLLATVRFFYLLLRKKPRNFLLNWMQIGAVTTTIFLMFVLKLPKTTFDSDQANEIARSIQKDLKDSLATGVAEGKKLEGDFGTLSPVVEILNDLRSEVAALQKEMAAEVDQYDFENLFVPENITNPDKLSRLKGNLIATKSKIQELTIKHKEIQDSFVTKLAQADIDPAQKQQLFNGFEEERPAADKVFNEFMKNEIAVYQKLIDIFTFFEERQGEFKLVEKMPYFSSEINSKAFNDLIASMQSLGTDRDRLAQKMILQQEETIIELDKYK